MSVTATTTASGLPSRGGAAVVATAAARGVDGGARGSRDGGQRGSGRRRGALQTRKSGLTSSRTEPIRHTSQIQPYQHVPSFWQAQPATRSSSLASPAGAPETTDERAVSERDWVAQVARAASRTVASAPPVSSTEGCCPVL